MHFPKGLLSFFEIKQNNYKKSLLWNPLMKYKDWNKLLPFLRLCVSECDDTHSSQYGNISKLSDSAYRFIRDNLNLCRVKDPTMVLLSHRLCDRDSL